MQYAYTRVLYALSVTGYMTDATVITAPANALFEANCLELATLYEPESCQIQFNLTLTKIDTPTASNLLANICIKLLSANILEKRKSL